jgi:hypothetical protein
MVAASDLGPDLDPHWLGSQLPNAISADAPGLYPGDVPRMVEWPRRDFRPSAGALLSDRHGWALWCRGAGVGEPLASCGSAAHACAMFSVDEATAEAIRRVFNESGELSAAIELRRHFPGITDNVAARLCVRTIASWKPLPPLPRKRTRTCRTRLSTP